ncbi:MAG TPA: PIG-L family deacetylase [Actinomycetota bacterium]
MEGLGTVLGVWAHPDDETYLSAALMASCVDAGRRVVCVTATRGEGGSQDPERWPPEQMAEIRQAELERCMAVLGVTDHRWLDYVDGTCHTIPDDEGTARIRSIIEEVRPDTVLTFGPEGMTGHEDHKAVHRWTTAAFEQVAAPAARLFYATITPEWAERYVPLLEPHNVYLPGTPIPTPRAELGICHEFDGALLDRKISAILEHASQVEGLYAAFGADAWRAAMSGEYYRHGP